MRHLIEMGISYLLVLYAVCFGAMWTTQLIRWLEWVLS